MRCDQPRASRTSPRSNSWLTQRRSTSHGSTAPPQSSSRYLLPPRAAHAVPAAARHLSATAREFALVARGGDSKLSRRRLGEQSGPWQSAV
eukprot:6878084-Prymnesium_polylepis.1